LKETSRRDKKKKPGKCNYCKKAGHWEKECCTKLADAAKSGDKDKSKDNEKSDKPKTELSAKIAAVVSDEDEPVLWLFVAHELKLAQSSVEWIVDSGASASMTCHCEWFRTFHALASAQRVVIGDGRTINAMGIGSVELKVEVMGGKSCQIILQGVYFIPNLDGNLLSVPHLTNKGYEASFSQCTCMITQNGSIAAIAERQQSLYMLKGQTCASKSAYIVEGPSPFLNVEEPITALIACTYSSRAMIETWHH